MTDSEIDEFEALAREATGGEWSIEQHGPKSEHYVLYSGRNTPLAGTEHYPFGPMYGHGLNLLYISDPDSNGKNNIAYMEKASPMNILSLIKRIRELESAQ